MKKKIIILTLLSVVIFGCIAAKNETLPSSLEIIPSPKFIEVIDESKFTIFDKNKTAVIVLPNNASLKMKMAADILNDELFEKYGRALGITSTSVPSGKNIIYFYKFENAKNFNALCKPYHLERQGYSIKFTTPNEIQVSAFDEQGFIYAILTFVQMLQYEGNRVFVRRVNVIDWPDFKKRMGFALPVKNFDDGKKLVDFSLKCKFNYMKNILPESEIWPEIKKLNKYAQARGLKIMYVSNWSIGDCNKHKNDPSFKGCIQFKGQYYCWSRDNLLEAKIDKYCEFVKETEAAAMAFHCLDSYEENWPERCDKCRKRFDNNRAAADAHFINLVSKKLREVNKNIELFFITQPYGINLDLEGNEKYKTYYEKLTKSIPEDVYLTVTGYDHDIALSWNKTVRQPLIRWQNGGTFQLGRFFDSEPCFFKGVYFSDRDDLAYIGEPFFHFDGEIMALIGCEYMWNTNAPGSMILREDKEGKIKERCYYHYRDKKIKGKLAKCNPFDGSEFESDDFDETLEPRETCFDLLEKVCRKLYGNNIAPFMSEYLRKGVKGWRSVNIANKIADSLQKTEKQYQKCSEAILILKKALQKTKSKKEKETLMHFYKLTLLPTGYYGCRTVLYKTVGLLKKDIERAKESIEKCRKLLQTWTDELKENQISKKFAKKWISDIEKRINFLELKIDLAKSKAKKSNLISVAIYNPNDNGGWVAPFETIFNCLKKQKLLKVEFIDNLKKATLQKYRVLIMPQVKRFPEKDKEIYRENIRWFVIKNGGGAYFEHDSVGFYRSAINKSVLPEICEGGVGREESHRIKVSAKHPITCNCALGQAIEHMYWDHIILNPGKLGRILLENEDGKPVLVAGQIGEGRAIFSGLATLGRDDQEKEDAWLIDKVILTDGIYWLAKQKLQSVFNGKTEFWSNADIAFTKKSSPTKNSGTLNLQPNKKYVEIMSNEFKISPNKQYLVTFHYKRQGSFRIIFMFVLYNKNHSKRMEINLKNITFKENISGNNESFESVITIPQNDEYVKGCFRIYLDWIGGNKSTPAVLDIINPAIYEIKK